MKLIISLLAASLLASCATTIENQAYSPAEAYRHYLIEATKENIASTATQFFANSILAGKDLADPSIQSQLLFKDFMASEKPQIYQTLQGNAACLTVNGYDKEKLPVAINLLYIKTHSSWLISEIGVKFLETNSEFESQGRCPISAL